MITKVIKLDINKKMFETITAKQGDTKSRFILFNLYDGPIQFDLTGRTVRVYGKKKDNTTIFNDLVITDAKKGYCTLELTNQMLAVEGMNELELVIFEGEKRLSTMPFILNVIGSKYSEDAIVSTNEFTALMNALKTVSNIDNKAEKKDVEELSSQLETKANKIEIGTPLIASSVDEMKDKTKVYVNTSDGNWYSWNGTKWIIGGLYNSQGIGDDSVTPSKLYGSKTLVYENKFGEFDSSKTYTYAGYEKVVNLDGSVTLSFTNSGSSTNNMRFAHELPFLLELNHKYMVCVDATVNTLDDNITNKKFVSANFTPDGNSGGTTLNKPMIDKDVNMTQGERKSFKFEIEIDNNKLGDYSKHYLFTSPCQVNAGCTFSITYHNFCVIDMGDVTSQELLTYEQANDLFSKYGFEDFYDKIIDIKAARLKDFSVSDYLLFKEYVENSLNKQKTEEMKIVCFGDSSTHGSCGEYLSPDGSRTNYPKVLQELTGITTINSGVGGDKLWDIFARVGADPLILNNITIPSDTTPVNLGNDLKTMCGNKFNSLLTIGMEISNYESGRINPVFINGIEGKLYRENDIYYFQRRYSGTSITLNRPTVVVTDFMKNNRNKNDIYVFYVGQNGGYTDVADWISQIKRAVEYIGCDKYVVIACQTNQSYSSWEAKYIKFYNAFGSRFVNLHRYILDYGLQDSNIIPTEQDNTDILNGICPSSLKKPGDTVHFNHFGYTVIGQVLYKRLKDLYPKLIK